MWMLQNIDLRINMINIETKCILFTYQEKFKLGNFLLAVAKHFYKNKFSEKQININSFIFMP